MSNTSAAMRLTARSLHRLSRMSRKPQSRLITTVEGRSTSLPGRLTAKEVSAMFLSSDAGSRVLSKSSILLQDGLEFHELPLVIRRLTAKELPFTTAMYTGEGLRKISQQEEHFQQQLLDCSNLRQVFQLLEVPGDQVTGYSASFALQRLCQLQGGTNHAIDTFLRKAVFKELCDTVTREIDTLTNATVINLVKCYLHSDTIHDGFIRKVNDEVETRIGDSGFSIEELCFLVESLCENIRGSSELVENIWIHLSNRYSDMKSSELGVVYSLMRYLTPKQKRFMLPVMGKQLSRCWWELGVDDVAAVTHSMALLNHKEPTLLRSLSHWLSLHLHSVQDIHMKHILTAYNHFNHLDWKLVQSLERYIPLKIETMDKSLVGLAMTYCLNCRILSTRIFDAVAKDFANNPSKYEPHEMFFALRPFGYLNYLPAKTMNFFLAIEEKLQKSFGNFRPNQILELLTTFTYLQRIPINFLGNVFNPHFLTKIRGLNNQDIMKEAGRNLEFLYCSTKLEQPSWKPPYIDTKVFYKQPEFTVGRWSKLKKTLERTLLNFMTAEHFRTSEHIRHTPHCIDFELAINEKGELLNLSTERKYFKRIAIVTVMPEHICVNTKHLMGEYATKQRHLELLGYSVLNIYYDQFMWGCPGIETKRAYLEEALNEKIQSLIHSPKSKAS